MIAAGPSPPFRALIATEAAELPAAEQKARDDGRSIMGQLGFARVGGPAGGMVRWKLGRAACLS